ncbi:MAG: hypothetical protein M3016_04870, partial [Actinomycetota bacterium]|nr:hypothetical protein [Actinomycetota bacterium]
HLMFVPQGFNLEWSTSLPLPSLLLAPVTLAFGVVSSWNVLELLAPALSAWTAFLLCRHVTGRRSAALVGGYLFGFSPYSLLHLSGGPDAAMVALLPIFVLLVVRRLDGTLAPRRFQIGMTVALVAQYLISTEVLLGSALFGVVALAIAALRLPARRGDLLATARAVVLAFVATVVVVSPFLYFFLFGTHYPPGATFFSAPLVAFVAPPSLTAVVSVLGLAQPRGANLQTYLGLPWLGILALFAWQERRSRIAQVLLACLVVAAVLSLGAHLSLRGPTRLSTTAPTSGLWLPWALLVKLPVLRYATPLRFALFVALPAAVAVSMWLAHGGTGRWTLAIVAMVCVIPAVGDAAWSTDARDPAFFAGDAYRRYLRPTDNVLTFPAFGPNERWQADTGYSFRLADGYLGNPFPPSYSGYPIWSTLVGGPLIHRYGPQLRRFMTAKHVTAIVVQASDPGPWPQLFQALGARASRVGGVLFYRVASAPA